MVTTTSGVDNITESIFCASYIVKYKIKHYTDARDISDDYIVRYCRCQEVSESSRWSNQTTQKYVVIKHKDT